MTFTIDFHHLYSLNWLCFLLLWLLCSLDGIFLSQNCQPLSFFFLFDTGDLVLHALLKGCLPLMFHHGPLHLKPLLHICMLLQNHVLCLFLREEPLLASLSLLLRSQPCSLSPIQSLLVQFFLQTGITILSLFIFLVLLSFKLQILPFLIPFGLFDALCNYLSPFISLLADVFSLVLFHFRKVLDFLLLGHYFIQSFDLFLLESTACLVSVHFLDFFNSFIQLMRLVLDVLILPVFRPLLTYLQLDFQRVERLYYVLIRHLLILVLSDLRGPLTTQKIFLTLARLPRISLKCFLSALFDFHQILLISPY